MTRALGVVGFVTIAVAGIALDWRNRRPVSHGPTFPQAIAWLQARRAGQIAVFAAWAFAGWHFFVR